MMFAEGLDRDSLKWGAGDVAGPWHGAPQPWTPRPAARTFPCTVAPICPGSSRISTPVTAIRI